MAATIKQTPEKAPEADNGSRTQINVVLFSGGSGTDSITKALLQHPQISLRILINAYDDGHSTGRLRKFIPGMLGPSDVRKNINRLMPLVERSQRALKQLSDYRLAVGISREDALRFLDAFVLDNATVSPASLQPAFLDLRVGQAKRLRSFVETFLKYFHEQEALGRHFDFTDCAVGNILFAGCYLEQGQDFNQAIVAFCEFYEVAPEILLNITLGENLFLVAEKENGTFVLNEADLVAAQDAAKISGIYLMDEQTYRTRVEEAQGPPSEGWRALFQASHVMPRLNPGAGDALRDADVIIYGPGTQHSSLFPSYLTEGVAEAISGNPNADKIFIGNIHRDYDIQGDDANDLARKLIQTLGRNDQVKLSWTDVVTHFFIHRTDTDTLSQAKYVPFDEKRFSFPLETVKARNWESYDGRHSGGYVLDELQQIVQARIDIELERLQHMVSIIIPVLNEERTIEDVLKSVTALDFLPLGLTKEVIMVDGASTDRSVEIASRLTSVKVARLPRQMGRGAALRMGIEQARGNIIVFFPGDNEYRASDLFAVVNTVVKSRFRAVLGTRAVKCTDLSERLKQIYQNNWRLYVTSKYGGILLSVLTLVLYNRYVSDILTSVKAFDAQLLRSLDLRSDGIEMDTELIAKISRRREYLFELPVDYKPRNRSEGKKITALDGLKAILALFRYRFSRQS
jgi:2-phospho-L-lactate transferase/gluconeogenesis factor (CofD/UPF0052 family)